MTSQLSDDTTSAPPVQSKPGFDFDPLSKVAERFVIERRLGAGASGAVYRAFDEQRGTTIALKALTAIDPASLYRFKSEFRVLANLAHPNLLQLYELVSHRDIWLLTMELIEGVDFLSHLRPPLPAPSPERDDANAPATAIAADTAAETEFEVATAIVTSAALTFPVHAASPGVDELRAEHMTDARFVVDEARLRAAFLQLCDGLHALHRAERLHRDLKPANVLVASADARVVICDFGLTLEGVRPGEIAEAASSLGLFRGNQREIAGTPAYMSPEQAQAQTLTAASDWYSVGVMLYQALTGRLPFGRAQTIEVALRAKLHSAPLDPRRLIADVPEELALLALALLHPNPDLRAGHAELSRVFGGGRHASRGSHAARRASAARAVIGRDAQFDALEQAFNASQTGQPTLALVSGLSGMGKSTLVQQVLAELEAERGAVVLRARCYEREELAYKALDPLVDALSTHLLRLDQTELSPLLPRTMPLLAAMFPALRRVPAIAQQDEISELRDPRERRRLAFVALRELCRTLSRQRPLVLFIDDLQWGDLDSAPVLSELLAGPDAPALLIVCAYRSEDAERSPILALLRQMQPENINGVRRVEIAIGPLASKDARRLALSLLGEHGAPEAAAELIAREAEGSPFFVRELAEYVAEHGIEAAVGIRLDALIRDKVGRLPSEARELLSVIAVAGRPIEPGLLQAASELGPATLKALRLLEVRRLTSTSGGNEREQVECYHDRIREAVYQQLPDERRRALHQRLAELLERAETLDADALLAHWRGAGERTKAGDYALQGAALSERALAWRRAADLYREALSLLPASDARRAEISERLGHALILAGRGTDAAAVFRELIPGAAPDRALTYRMLATTQLLRAGKLADGFAELERAEDLFAVRFPQSEAKALAMLLARRARLRLTEHRLTLRESARDPSADARLEALWEVAAAVSIADLLRGGVYSAELMLRAIEQGDPSLVAGACGLEAVTAAAANDVRRTEKMLALAVSAGEKAEHLHLIGRVRGMQSICRQLAGRWLESIQLAQESQQLQLRSARSNWDHAIMVWWEIASATMAGRLSEVGARIPEALRDAEARGDVYAATSFRTHRSSWAWLVIDRPDVADAEVGVAEQAWIPSGYQFQHWHMTYARSEVDLYRGTPIRSLERLTREWGRARLVRQVQAVRSDILYSRGRLLLAAAGAHPRPSVRKCIAADGSALIGQGMPWTIALGTLLQAAAASLESHTRALELLARAEGLLEAVHMPAHAAACQLRRGELLRAREGQELAASALDRIRTLGAREPERFAAMLLPRL